MRRSMRVATIFTGAAACAVTLVPAAHAAPAGPRATIRATPDAVAGNCNENAGAVSSVVLYYATSQRHPDPACIGGEGWVYFGTGKRFKSYCAGAYSGSLEVSGSFKRFTKGTHNLYNAMVEGIYISSDNHPGTTCAV